MKPDSRLLFNIDCNSWFYDYRPRSAFYRPHNHRMTAKDIHAFVDLIADAGVDTLVVNSATELAWYPSKRLPTALDGYRRGDRTHFYGHVLGHAMTPAQIERFLAENVVMMNRYLDLAEAGVDWLAETEAACRRRDVRPWASIRMNDMHGATKLPEGSYLNGPLFKDPAMRLRGTGYNPAAPPSIGWQGLNYAKREVRDHMLAVIREPVEDYGYEGVELDWTRSPLCLEPVGPEGGVSRTAVDMMTAWHAEVRRITERRAERLGRPCPLGLRYMGTLDQMRSIGLDLRAMLREGILDYLEPTNSWQTSWDLPCDELKAEVGPDVAVYGVIELGPNWLHGLLPAQTAGNAGIGESRAVNYRLMPACPPLMRGNAAAKLVLGCDGISVMNFMPGDQPSHWPWPEDRAVGDLTALRGLPDLEGLRGHSKAYTLPSQVGYYRHETFETVAPFPLTLGPGEGRACRIPMCAEPEAGSRHRGVRRGAGHELVVQVVVEKKESLPLVGVSLNGAWPRFDGRPDDRLLFPVGGMTHHVPEHVGLDFAFPASAIREGWNEVVVLHGTPKDFWTDQKAQFVRVQSLELAVRPAGGTSSRTAGRQRSDASVRPGRKVRTSRG